jgi:hypothetical protein
VLDAACAARVIGTAASQHTARMAQYPEALLFT